MVPFDNYTTGAARAVNGAELIDMSSERKEVQNLFPLFKKGYIYYLWDGIIREESIAANNPSQPSQPSSPKVEEESIAANNPSQPSQPSSPPNPCLNPKIHKRIEGNKVVSYNGCDATMENCREIFTTADGKPRNPPPNLKSYFYEVSKERTGCRLRCPGMRHMIEKDYKDSSGQVVNVCRQLGTTPGGRRGVSKRKKK
jgi:hypothetical protein